MPRRRPSNFSTTCIKSGGVGLWKEHCMASDVLPCFEPAWPKLFLTFLSKNSRQGLEENTANKFKLLKFSVFEFRCVLLLAIIFQETNYWVFFCLVFGISSSKKTTNDTVSFCFILNSNSILHFCLPVHNLQM